MKSKNSLVIEFSIISSAEEVWEHTQRNTHSAVLLVTSAQRWKQPGGRTQWLNRSNKCGIISMKCGIQSYKTREIPVHAMTRINLEDITLSEIRQSHQDK